MQRLPQQAVRLVNNATDKTLQRRRGARDIAQRVAIQIACRVKPNAAPQRRGIAAVTDDKVEVCVPAQPRDGEANREVLKVLGEALDVPASDLTIVSGHKSRDKIVVAVLSMVVARDVGSMGSKDGKSLLAAEEKDEKRELRAVEEVRRKLVRSSSMDA